MEAARIWGRCLVGTGPAWPRQQAALFEPYFPVHDKQGTPGERAGVRTQEDSKYETHLGVHGRQPLNAPSRSLRRLRI